VSGSLPSIGPSTVVRAAKGHWCADAADETVILHAKSAEYFGLNHVGSRTWALLDQGLSVRELTQALACEYGVTSARIETDLVPFLTELVETGLAEIVIP
jgi:hypothetical protein